MMLIKMRTTIAGPRGTASPGDVIDRPDNEAAVIVGAGFAVPCDARGNELRPSPQTGDVPDAGETADATDAGDTTDATSAGETATTGTKRKTRAR